MSNSLSQWGYSGDGDKHRLRPQELANQTRNFPSFTRHRRQGPSSSPLPSRAPRRADPRNSRAAVTPHATTIAAAPPPTPTPLPAPPSHHATVSVKSSRDPRATLWIRVKSVQGNDWHRKNIHQCQAVSRVTRSSVWSLTRCGRVLCCGKVRRVRLLRRGSQSPRAPVAGVARPHVIVAW